MKKKRTILGIDPGTNILGWGIVSDGPDGLGLVDLGHLNLSKIEDPYEKLHEIHHSVTTIIANYKPTESSFESPFHGKNIQSMLKLGRAQGVAIAACFAQGLSVHEYAPKKIKQSITGNGNASKEQLAKMLQSILGLVEIPKYLDATDGVAAAVCHSYQNAILQGNGKSYSGWKAFLAQHPDRAK
ncbi:MAG: crossover junction endodeoxyribonuclease RuvC [Bacteroidetes bacterium]|nr:crossover junction endodeoxyribonuclease RuvC [Bacteroidota bacterium]